MDIIKTAELLCGISAPSGFEGPVANAAREILEPMVDECYIDVMGNLIGVRRSGIEGAPKLLLDAHIDEIGFIVTGVEEGFLRFQTLGGVDKRMLPAREVVVLTEPPLFGVVTCQPPHILSAADMDKATEISDMYIDVGLSDEEAKKLVRLGTPVVFAAGFSRLGEKSICSKSFDDRLCFAAILGAVDKLRGAELGCDLYIMGSTQEELGMRGAEPGAFGIDPDYAIAVDVTHAKTPDAKPEDCVDFGGGPAICVGPNINAAMSDKLIGICEELNLPYQVEVAAGNTGTNAWKMQTIRCGVATALVSIPVKYMHSPVETAHVDDVENAAELLAAFVKALDKGGLR